MMLHLNSTVTYALLRKICVHLFVATVIHIAFLEHFEAISIVS